MFYQSDIPWLNLCQFSVLIHLTKGIAKLKVLGCRLIFARDGLPGKRETAWGQFT